MRRTIWTGWAIAAACLAGAGAMAETKRIFAIPPIQWDATMGRDRPAQVYARINLAQLLSLQGKVEEALRNAQQALALSREAGFDVGQARALNVIAWWNVELGRHAEAVPYGEEALLLFRKLNKLIASGVLATEPGASFPLDRVADAMREAAKPGRQGKVLLRMGK